MLLRPFESENDEKSLRIEKSQQENAKICALHERTPKFSDLDEFLNLD
jgi:hypothetical protein